MTTGTEAGTARPRVLVADTFAPEGLQMLQAGADVDVKKGLNEQDLAAALVEGRYEGLVVRSESKVTATVLGASPLLRVVARAGVGIDNIDVPAATRRGVLVLNMPTGNIVTTGEHTMSLLCAMVRSIPQANAALRAGRWERSPYLGMELSGKTLGVVGLGRVGTQITQRAQGFGMRVLAYDPYIAPEVAERLHVTLVPYLDDMLPQVDIVTVHTPLNDETRGIIGAHELALLPRGARVVNCARGGIVDEAALLAALDSEHIRAAALDVYVGEPIRDPNHPLVSHPRVVCTPHLGSATLEAEVAVAMGTARETLTALAGLPAATAVNVPMGGPNAVEDIAPYTALATSLARLAVQWDRGPLSQLRVGVTGELTALDTAPLVAGAIVGILASVTDERVNAVNARLVASERGLNVEETRSSAVPDGGYRGALSVSLRRDDAHVVELSGVVVHGQPHLLSINGYRLDVPLSDGEWLVTRHHDRPGMIGAIGQLLGVANVNIGFMQVGRDEPRGVALMVVGVDSPVPDEVLASVEALTPIQSVRRLHVGVRL